MGETWYWHGAPLDSRNLDHCQVQVVNAFDCKGFWVASESKIRLSCFRVLWIPYPSYPQKNLGYRRQYFGRLGWLVDPPISQLLGGKNNVFVETTT